MLRRLTRKLVYTFAEAARREAAARFAFEVRVVSWRCGLPYEECSPLPGRLSCGADNRTCARRGFSEREYNKSRGV